jgi:hypothetical protein
MHCKNIFSWFQTAQRHVEDEPSYRFYPAYSFLLALIVWVPLYWPFDLAIVEVWRNHNWVAILDECATTTALWLAVCLGVVGLLRRPLIAKIASGVGIWMSLDLLIPYLLYPLTWVTGEIFWYSFDLPSQWIERVAGTQTNASTMLWSLYLFVAWLVFRPALKKLPGVIRRLEGVILERWPFTKKYAKPLF